MSQKNNYFFCPASGYLNKHNEKGSLGQISYQFLQALSDVDPQSRITAVVFKSYRITSFKNVTITPFIKNAIPNGISSFIFYLKSYLHFVKSPVYKKANIVHHLLPFTPHISFNLFFIFKDPSKKYVLGPLIGPHINTKNFRGDDPPDGNNNYLKTQINTFLSNIAPLCLNFLNVLTIRNADIVLFSDNYALNSYSYALKNNQKTQITGIGIDLKTFKKSNEIVTRSKNSFKVLFIGRLTERKGCKFLIRAISEVTKMQPQLEISCQIIGSGSQENELKELVKNLDLSRNIRFLGNMPNNLITKYYATADVVCIPALSDTWMTAKEALACGKPVIITNIASHPEIVQDRVNGFLVPIMDPKSIADKLLILANDEKLKIKLSENAYTGARMKYDWKKIVNSYLQALKELNENH